MLPAEAFHAAVAGFREGLLGLDQLVVVEQEGAQVVDRVQSVGMRRPKPRSASKLN